jgi:hypothetical protein
MPRLALFLFRYLDALTGKWRRARYRAELHEIQARHSDWETIGPPEIRDVDPEARYFSPYRGPPVGNLVGIRPVRMAGRPVPIVGTAT